MREANGATAGRARRAWSAMALALIVALPACQDTVEPVPPDVPANLTVTQLSLTSVRATWDAVTGADSYRLERADASNPGVFTQVGGSLTDPRYDDTALAAGVSYSYRVAAAAGGMTSEFAAPVSIATGLKAATLSANITASRTLKADTVYTLSGYVKVTNGATLTIEAGTKIIGDTNTPGSSRLGRHRHHRQRDHQSDGRHDLHGRAG